jgi:PTH1 family peptidyl-tRNA hydrolase
VWRPPELDLADFVLAEFLPEELKLLREMTVLAADAVACLLGDGVDVAMNRFNGRRV